MLSVLFLSQDLHTGLIASSASSSDAWIRDNVYCISSVWALAAAYKAASDQSEDLIKVREGQGHTVSFITDSELLGPFCPKNFPKY